MQIAKQAKIVPIVFKTSASEDRPRRGRISITVGEESEANVTCGFSQLNRQDVLEEGEHKRAVQIFHMFALFEDGSTIIMGTAGFAAFGCSTSGYGCSPSSRTITCKQAQEGETDCPYCLYCL